MRTTALFIFSICAAFAQSSTSLNGTITDPTGAVIPGAKIALESPSTGLKREVVTDGAGRYLFAQLAPGKFKLSAKAKGFRDVKVNDIQLLVNTPATINLAFETLGTVTEAVSVSAEATQVNTTDASLGNALGSNISQLPLLSRNIAALLATQPGVTFIDGESGDDRDGAVNGGRSDQGNVMLDGVDVNDNQNRWAFTTVLRVTPDSVQEFRVTTANGGAELGKSSGAQTSIITKSGSNEVHGALYEYHRNTITSANDFFNNASGVPRAKLIRNQFGAAIGGPVIKNKLFFFLNWEGRRDASESNVLRTVPTASLRQGIVKYVRTDGSTGSLTADDMKSKVDPLKIGPNAAALQLFQSYPLPNDFSAGDGLNMAGYRFGAPIHRRENTYIAKFDYTIDKASKHTVFFRGNLQNDNENGAPQFPGEPAANVLLNNSKGFAVGYTAIFTNSLVGNTRYGLTRQGLETTGASTFGAVSFRGLDDRYALTYDYVRTTPVNHLSQDFNYNKGAHQVSFGAVVRVIHNFRTNYGNSYPQATTNASWLSGAGNGLRTQVGDLARNFRTAFYDAASAVLGIIGQGTASYNFDIKGNVLPVGAPIVRQFNGEEYEMYVQDSWKVTKSLNVTAGLRWNLFPPIHEANGNQTSPNMVLSDWFEKRGALAAQGLSQTGAGLITYLAAGDPNARPLYDFNKKNFSPRLGVAWSPAPTSGFLKKLVGGGGQTSIRAGFGMFYDIFGSGIVRLYDSNAFGLSTQLTNPSSALTESTAPRFTGVLNIPGALLAPAPKGGFPATYPNNFEITNGLDSAIKAPYSMNVNVSVAREFSKGLFVQAAYVGRFSRRSLVQEDLALSTNLKDPTSGMTYFEAAQQLAGYINKTAATASVPKIAFWENMFPGLATNRLTATQAAFQTLNNTAPDYQTALHALDVTCKPSCGKLGPYSMFNPQYSYLSSWRSSGRGNYNSLQLTVRKKFKNGDFADFNYTYSKSIDLRSTTERGDESNSIINPWLPNQMWALSDYDNTHSMNASYTYNIPFAKGLKGAAKIVLDGWQLSGLIKNTSGFPVSVGNGRNWPTNWNLTGYATQIAPRPPSHTTKNAPAAAKDGESGPNIFSNPAAALAAYDSTLPGETGQRNSVRGDGVFGVDMGLAKRFQIPRREKQTVQFRWETFNLSNSVRFDPAAANLDLGNSSNFGKYTAPFGSPRVMQFALRYEF